MDEILKWICKDFKEFDKHLHTIINTSVSDDMENLVVLVYANYKWCAGFISTLHSVGRISNKVEITIQQKLFELLKKKISEL